MRAVIVLAHPDPSSFTHAVADRFVRAWTRAGHEAVVHDLYADGFCAAMSAAEHAAYHGDAPILDPLVERYAADVRATDALVFVYPTWWSSLPAIGKAWLERVLVPGVGFVFDDAGKVRGGLKHLRRVIGISTYGSPHAVVRLVNDNGRRTILRALRMSAGLRTRSSWLGMYAMDRSTPEQREAFLVRVDRLAARA